MFELPLATCLTLDQFQSFVHDRAPVLAAQAQEKYKAQDERAWILDQKNDHSKSVTGLVAWRMGNQNLVLIRLLEEPGNLGIQESLGKNTRVLVHPTFRHAYADLLKKVIEPFSCKAGDPAVEWQAVPENGERFFECVNDYGLLRIDQMEEVLPELALTSKSENYAWVSIPVLRQICSLGLASADLRICMSLLV